MRSHVFRPLWIALGLLALFLTARALYVPGDFGVHRGDYTYGWYRTGNEDDWKAVQVKHRGKDYCAGCHHENYAKIAASKHARIQCENCHGPARDHPGDPPKLAVNRERDLCLRCHADLPYRPKVYTGLPGGPIPLKVQNPEIHNPGLPCVTCHSVHTAGWK